MRFLYTSHSDEIEAKFSILSNASLNTNEVKLVNRRRRRLELTARLHKRHPKDTMFVIKIAGKRTPVSHYMRGAFARSDAKQRNFTILSNAPVKTGEMELVL